MGPLAGVRALEVSRTVSGAYVGKLIGGLGAEVIKAEPPRVGDAARYVGPFAGDEPGTERSGTFFYFNTSKLGITADPDTATGAANLRRLAEQSDVVIVDAAPADIDRWGLRYDALSAANPKLVVVLLTPYGMTGPYRDRKAYNLNIVGGSGFSYILPTGMGAEESDPPLNPGGNQGELQGAIHATIGLLTALLHAEATGEGQEVEVSKQEATMVMDETAIEALTFAGMVRSRWLVPLSGLAQPLKCKDGEVHPLVAQEEHWARFVELMGNPDWAKEEIFATRDSRGEQGEALKPLIEEWTKQYTRHEIVVACQERSIPMVAVNDMREIRDSAHLRAREHFVALDHGDGLSVEYPRDPYRLGVTPAELSRPPRLGEHNLAVYCDRLGYSKEEIDEMAQAGVI